MFREIIKYLEDTSPDKHALFKGVVHVGAHLAEELDFYEKAGALNVIWVEANPNIYEKLVQKFNDRTNSGVTHKIINKCLSDEDGQIVDFNITNHTQSSSMLNLQEHSKYYPDVVVTSKIPVVTTTFHTLVETLNIDLRFYNFLCIDVQGAEMKVLKGFKNHLKEFNKICIEVNEEHLYENGALFEEIDQYLNSFGFEKQIVFMTDAKWGEALYVERSIGNSTQGKSRGSKPI